MTDTGLIKQSDDKEIKKHVAAIHCSNKLSLVQRKISNVLLYHAYDNLLSVETHQITVKQICNLINYSSNNHDVIKQALKGLLATVIEWNMVDSISKEEDWSASSILASVRIKGSLCYYSYSPRMRDLLHCPSVYAKINLGIQSKFKSNYGLALYENCVRYKLLPNTRWFELETFRQLMGVSPGTYTVFRDFKRRVLDKAVEEVNTYSDLYIQYELDRVGWKVVKLRFILEKRCKKPKFVPSKTKRTDTQSISALTVKGLESDFGVQPMLAQKLLQKYGEDVVQKKMDMIRQSKSYSNGLIKNLAGYLQSALAQDYQPTQSSAVKLRKRSQVQEEQSRVEQVEKEKLQKQYDMYVRTETDRILSTLAKNRLDDLAEKFANYMLRLQFKNLVDEYKNHGMKSERVQSLYRNFVRESSPDLFNLPSYSEFVRKKGK